jgi:hypothetical protein
MSNYQLTMQDPKGSIMNGFMMIKTMVYKIPRDFRLLKGAITPLGLLFLVLIAN